eukprot:TRINITY_DN47655_c0_g1_i1.p1 TRINITY_DN47655_c0_g1~~TRINITY_DN47655_c0_g1_i1.p1  ORF type:complete len:334 (+),score=101.66 TRINITY_DN47655_c0_g1_i1:49-1002(+)
MAPVPPAHAAPPPVPEFDANEFGRWAAVDFPDVVFSGAGCCILRNVFTPALMDRFNEWCEGYLGQREGGGRSTEANRTHPKQKSKFVVNHVVEALAELDPAMMTELLYNGKLTYVLDRLLGLATLGACTAHWIQPGGERQLMHVDFPMHVGSGKFWKGDVANIDRFTTRYQQQAMLPRHSVQVLIASDAMDESNGSTQLVPGTQTIADVDRRVHDPDFQRTMEPKFVSVKLSQGDVLIFNRRLCHRGGDNRSRRRRNALIQQWVWMWGIGQHRFASPERLWLSLEPHVKERLRDDDDVGRARLRLCRPYPLDTRSHY